MNAPHPMDKALAEAMDGFRPFSLYYGSDKGRVVRGRIGTFVLLDA